MLDLSDPSIAVALKNSADWRGAVGDLLALFASDNRPFSSGEIATALRTHRKDLVFSVPKVGEFIRDQFYNQALPLYVDQSGMAGAGTTIQPVQVSRFTVGKFRTPANTEVFVYGPDTAACNGHEFEVYVAKPGETVADAPAPSTTATNVSTGPGTPAHDGAVAAFGANLAANPLTTKVRADDLRLYVPRDAFDALCRLGDKAVRAGDPVYVTVEPGVKAVVTLSDPGNGAAKSYTMWKTGGRIAFGSPDATKPFTADTRYGLNVTATEITVDLANPL